jgi:uncharacterized protein (TIGR03437 family)
MRLEHVSVSGKANKLRLVFITTAAVFCFAVAQIADAQSPTAASTAALSVIGINPATITAGGTATVTLTLNGAAPAGGAPVSILSSNTAVFPTPASGYTVPAGQTTATFTVQTGSVTESTNITVSAGYGGGRAYATATVTPTPSSSSSVALTAVSIDPATLASGGTAKITLTLSAPAPAGGAAVTIGGNQTTLFPTPATYTIPAGQTSAGFTVQAGSVTASTTATIGATYGSGHFYASVTITPPTSSVTQLAGVSIDPETITSGGTATVTLKLSGPAPTGGASVTIGGNQTTLFPTPATYLVPAGQSTASFTVQAGTTTAPTEATISASYGGGHNYASVTVTPSTAPKVALSGISINPPSIPSGGTATVTLTLNGPAPAGGSPVSIYSGNTTAFPTPSAGYTVPAGQTSVSFPVQAGTVTSSTTVTVGAGYGGGKGYATITITSGPSTNAPYLINLDPSTVTAGGAAFTLTVNGNGFVQSSQVQWNGTLLQTTYSSPTRLKAAITSGLIVSAGTASITVTNPDGSVSRPLALTINSSTPPTITTTSLPGGAVGTAYAQKLSASGGSGHYVSWVLNSGALPPGLTLNATSGSISGTPKDGGGTPKDGSATPKDSSGSPYTFSIIVKDDNGNVSAPQGLSISINQPSGLTIVTSATLPEGTVGVPFSYAFVATGGAAPYSSWTITSGAPPAGTAFTAVGISISTALLTGTPTSAGTATFTVQVTDSAGATASKGFTLKIDPNGTVTISPNGIVNSSSYIGGSVAPGEIVTIFGTGMGPIAVTDLQTDSSGNIATTLAGVQVLFDSVPAPLIYVSATQIGAIVPYEVTGETSTQVQVNYQGQKSNVVTMPVAAAAPGIYTMDASGTGRGIILNQDGTLNSASNPAAPGSIVFLYATGEGQTQPSGIDGKLNGYPAPTPAQSVTATIGGANADVLYAGGVTGLAGGTLQVNLRVPSGGFTPGDAVPITLNIGGVTSQAGVTLAISGNSAAH